MRDLDVSKEWNQNILRNLHYKFPALRDVEDTVVLKRFYEWTGELCLSEEDPEYEQFMLTGE